MASRKGSKKQVRADRFFAAVCPRLMTAMQEKLAELGGRYVVVVEGEGGGAWTLDFGTGAVSEGAGAADLKLELTAEQFTSLASPKVELRKLVSDGTVKSEGDTDRVENLSLLFAFLNAG